MVNRHMHYFETAEEYNQERFEDYSEPWVSYTKGSGPVNYNKTEDEKLLETPFTIEVLEDGYISSNISYMEPGETFYYSKNGGDWVEVVEPYYPSIEVAAGDEVAFKGTIKSYQWKGFSFDS